jgi:anti-sigma factor RsiW
MSAPSREELLSAYLDDELSAEERAQVEAWLAESPEYRQLYEELRAVRHDLELLPRHKLDRDLGPIVLGKAERAVLAGNGRAAAAAQVQPRSAVARWWSQGRSHRMYLWPAAAVAAALLIALFNARQVGEREVARNGRMDDEGSSVRERRAAESGPHTEALGAANGVERKAGAEVEMLAKPASEADAEQAAPAAPAASPSRDASDRLLMKGKVAGPAPAAVPNAALFDQNYNYSVKMDSNVKRALEGSVPVQVIQCDVSPEFIKDNRMERVLTSNSVSFTRLGEAEANFQRNVITNQAVIPAKQLEQWYAVDANPEQVKQIVTELEREQGQKRVSNLALGVQEPVVTSPADLPLKAQGQMRANRYAKEEGARSQKVPQAGAPAQAPNEALTESVRQSAKDEKILPVPADKQPKAMFRQQQLQQSPPLTIWLRAMDAANEAPPPAKP